MGKRQAKIAGTALTNAQKLLAETATATHTLDSLITWLKKESPL